VNSEYRDMTIGNMIRAVYRRFIPRQVAHVTTRNWSGTPETFLYVADGSKTVLIFYGTHFNEVEKWDIKGDGLMVFRNCTFNECNKPSGDRIMILPF